MRLAALETSWMGAAQSRPIRRVSEAHNSTHNERGNSLLRAKLSCYPRNGTPTG